MRKEVERESLSLREGEFESERVRERMLSERDREKAKYSVCGMKGK